MSSSDASERRLAENVEAELDRAIEAGLDPAAAIHRLRTVADNAEIDRLDPEGGRDE